MYRTTSQLAALISTILLLVGCGRSPLAGLDGEYCLIDEDCIAGLVCHRATCQPLESVGDAGLVVRDSYFFAGLRLSEWEGSQESGALKDFGEFISDLSTQLFPYYIAEAPDTTQVDFGMADKNANPVQLSSLHTVTSLGMVQSGTDFWVTDVTILVPIDYADESVELDFDMPLVNASMFFDFSSLEYGSTGTITLEGALRAVDATNLMVVSPTQTFSLFRVLEGAPLEIDTAGDGIPDAWYIRWTGTAEII